MYDLVIAPLGTCKNWKSMFIQRNLHMNLHSKIVCRVKKWKIPKTHQKMNKQIVPDPHTGTLLDQTKIIIAGCGGIRL